MKKALTLFILSSLLLAGFLAVLPGGAHAAVDTTGLVLSYDFRNGGSGTTITDTSGNAHNGTLEGTAYTWSSDYLEIKSGSYINVTNSYTSTENGTWEAWVEFNSFVSGADTYIMKRDVSGANNGDAGLRLYSVNYTLYANVGVTSGAVNVYSTFIPQTGIFYFITLVKSNTTLSIYVNGTLVGSGTVPDTTFGNSNADLMIPHDSSRYVSDVEYKYISVWNRALNSTEVQEHYEEITGNSEPSQIISFTNEGAFATIGVNLDGLTTDGTYIYADGDNSNHTQTTIYKFDTAGNLIKNATLSHSAGGIFYYDGYIYIAYSDNYSSPSANYIGKIDANTLTQVATYTVSGITSGQGINAIFYYDGAWYVGETASNTGTKIIWKLDSNWNATQQTYSSSDVSYGWQGATVVDDYVFVTGHGGELYILNASDNFSLVQELTGIGYEGITYLNYTFYMHNSSTNTEIYKYSISGLNISANRAYLSVPTSGDNGTGGTENTTGGDNSTGGGGILPFPKTSDITNAATSYKWIILLLITALIAAVAIVWKR